jgi:pentose-5-phosphate-3-epimerase
MSDMNVESWKAMYDGNEIYEVMQINYEVTEKLQAENKKLRDCVEATEEYLEVDGSINADRIYDALAELKDK